jgi:sortase A
MQKPTGTEIAQKTGKSLITAGILLFLFAMYQLFGTAYVTARAQVGLTNDFSAVVEEVAADKSTQVTLNKLETITIIETVTETVETTETIETQVTSSPFENLTASELADLQAVIYQPEGEAIAQLQSEEMNLNSIIVQGTSVADLRKGPGHYIDSAALCTSGNAAIAGHRTTYGSPFGDIANLAFGDEIYVHTAYGSCTYTVTQRFVVQPNETWVVKDQGDNRLTLTSCHPKYSAAQRYIVVAQLTESSAPYLPTQEEIDELIAATAQTTVTSSQVTTSEVVETEIETQVEVPCEDCEEVQTSVQNQEQANTVGEGKGFGTGLDGEGKSELFAVALYGILFFATWFRAYRIANHFGEAKGRKFKYITYAAASIPMIVAMAFWFYHVDLFLPSY